MVRGRVPAGSVLSNGDNPGKDGVVVWVGYIVAEVVGSSNVPVKLHDVAGCPSLSLDSDDAEGLDSYRC